MRIKSRHINNIITSHADEGVAWDDVAFFLFLCGLVGFFAFGMITAFTGIEFPQSVWLKALAFMTKSSLLISCAGLVGGAVLGLSGYRKKRKNKVLQNNNINVTMDDIEQMSDEQLNALCSLPLFSKYRPLTDEEIIDLNEQIKKYGTRSMVQQWKDVLHDVRETPHAHVRQQTKDEFQPKIDEQQYHQEHSNQNLINTLLIDDVFAETDELIISQNKRCS